MSGDKKVKKRGSVLQRLGLINTKELVPSSTPGGAEPPPGSIAATALRGILKKQSLNNAFVFQTRWCVVDPERHEFLYWNKEEDEAEIQPSFRIRLRDCATIEYIFDKGSTVGSKIRFVMKANIRPPHMVFRCQDTDESAKWLTMLLKHKDLAMGLCEINLDEPEYKIDEKKIAPGAKKVKAEDSSDDGLSSDEDEKPVAKEEKKEASGVPTKPPPGSPTGSGVPTKPPPAATSTMDTMEVPEGRTRAISRPDTPPEAKNTADSDNDSENGGAANEPEEPKVEEAAGDYEEF